MLLAFEVVLFGGLAFMFFCILLNQDSMLKTMREEHGAILSTLAKPGSPRPFVSALNKNYSSPMITLRMTSISLASDPPPLHWASTSATSSRNIS